MGKLGICAVAAVAATLFTGSAQAGSDGFVSGQAGAGVFTPADGSMIGALVESYLPDEGTRPTADLRGQASGSFTFDNGFGAQADFVASSLVIDGVNFTYGKASVDGALHLFMRPSDQYLLGGFAQFGRDSYEFTDVPFYEAGRSYGGIEGQVYLDNLTLYAQLGLAGMSASSVGLAESKGWFGTLEARYFVTPDLKLTANVGLFKMDLDAGEVAQTGTNLVLGIGAEYKLADLPLSLTANLDYGQSTTTYYGGEHNATRALVGLKFAFGEETLLDRDRKGTSLKPIEPSEFLWIGDQN